MDISNLPAKVVSEIRTELINNLFIWRSIALLLGVALYFALSFEPEVNVAHFILGLSLVIYLTSRCYNNENIQIAGASLLLVFLGFYISTVHTRLVGTKLLKQSTEAIWVEGDVEKVWMIPEGARLLLNNVSSKALPHHLNKVRIKLNHKQLKLNAGDRVLVKAILQPPPPPTIHDGFNFARYAYFKKISAIGYAVGKLRIIAPAKTNSFNTHLENLRNIVKAKINNTLVYPYNSVAIGLLTGDIGNIKEADFKIIRSSGLAHLLAISGMHMVVVTAICFAFAMFCLKLSPYIILHFSIKKIAAAFSLLAAFCYLVLTDFPISAQRAFVITAIIMVGYMLDRQPKALNSLALALIVIMLLAPHEILNPSLQMSFAACLALISTFNLVHFKWLGQSQKATILKYFLSTMLATLAASFATTPFIIYHFNNFSPYSALANVIAVPINDFFVMPLGLIALLLMPFDLEHWALKLMAIGIECILQIAKIVDILPNSLILLPKLTTVGLTLSSIGIILYGVFDSKVRVAGVILMLLGISTVYLNPKPDIMIDSKGNLFAVLIHEKLYFSSLTTSRYVRKVWTQGTGASKVLKLDKAGFDGCTSKKCILSKNDLDVLIINQKNSTDHCNDDSYNMIIDLANNLQPPCLKQYITKEDILKAGGYSIWLKPNHIIIRNNKGQSTRPWDY